MLGRINVATNQPQAFPLGVDGIAGRICSREDPKIPFPPDESAYKAGHSPSGESDRAFSLCASETLFDLAAEIQTGASLGGKSIGELAKWR